MSDHLASSDSPEDPFGKPFLNHDEPISELEIGENASRSIRTLSTNYRAGFGHCNSFGSCEMRRVRGNKVLSGTLCLILVRYKDSEEHVSNRRSVAYLMLL